MKTGVISSKYISSRIDGRFYLNDDAYNTYVMERNRDKCAPLEKYAYVFNPPIFKRQFCNKNGNSILYYQSSDITTLLPSDTYIFKGQSEKLNLLVHKGDILITGFGSIGDACMALNIHNNSCFANNVCRVRVNEGIKSGYILAVIKSKYGKSQLINNASGSVVRYIEAPRIKQILIPVFPDDFQAKVDDLIQESSRLREEAADLLEKAKKMVEEFISEKFVKHYYKCQTTSFNNVLNSLRHRLDPPALINDGVSSMDNVISKHNTRKISEIDCKVYRPGIFKRCYVQNGIPYIKGSEIFMTNPFLRCDYLSKTKTPFVDEMKLKEGQILITCAGSVGETKYITKEYEKKKSIGSQDIIRLESTDNHFTREYLFAYLQQKFVFDYIQSMKYGSVIERIEPFHVESIPVVEPTKDLSETVTKIIQQYSDCTYKAFVAEENAISLVEKAIESWEK